MAPLLAAVLTSILTAAPGPTPVLVELFTSEGCSSCPPAEALLRAVAAADPGVWVIEEHVDYWNDLGWADPFSSEAFTARQQRYAAASDGQVYTPQAVVNGAAAFVGSNPDALQRALAAARRAPPALLEVDWQGAQATVRGRLSAGGTLWVALVERGLSSKVPRGENRGQTLRHGPVARFVRRVGPVSAGPLERAVPLGVAPADAQTLIAFVEERASGHIVGLGAAKP